MNMNILVPQYLYKRCYIMRESEGKKLLQNKTKTKKKETLWYDTGKK